MLWRREPYPRDVGASRTPRTRPRARRQAVGTARVMPGHERGGRRPRSPPRSRRRAGAGRRRGRHGSRSTTACRRRARRTCGAPPAHAVVGSAEPDRVARRARTRWQRARPTTSARVTRRRRTYVRCMSTRCPNACSESRVDSNICLHPLPAAASVAPTTRRLVTMSDITARQQRILDFIAETVRERGYPPTVREIGEAVGLTSSSSVHAQLANLERKGLLHKDPTKPRADDPRRARRPPSIAVPLVGRIAAGAPILAERARRGVRRGAAGLRRRRRALRPDGRRRLDDRRRASSTATSSSSGPRPPRATATSWPRCCPARPRTRPPSSGSATTAPA